MGYLDEEAIDTDSRSDEEILHLSLSRPSEFAILVDKYEDAFMRKALRILRTQEEAEDAVQEAFTKIYMYAPRFKTVEGASFSSWGYKILINTCLTKYQKKKKESGARVELDPEFYEMLPDGVDTKGERELRDEIASVLVRMPESFATALTKHFIDGKPHEEAAREEGISEGAIKTRVHRAKKEFEKIYTSLQPPK
jgi:RNA polymerase sigma-70 factor (ECF subfamily)